MGILHIKRKIKASIARRLFTACMALCAFTPAVQADSGYTFGVVPQFEPRRLSAIWTPILAEIENRTGIELRMVGSPRIPEFENSFQNGEFDFAYMNPYHLLVAHSAQGYLPIIRDGGRKLFGVLVVRKDSGIKTVKDLAGNTIAFPAPNALGASLLMRAQLDRDFGVDITPSYVSTHTSAYLNAALGETAAAGGVMATFSRLDPEIRDQLEIIFTTRRVSPHPVAAHPRVPEKDRKKIQAAFLELASTPEGQKMLSQVPIGQATAATAEDYSPLADLKLENYYISTN